MTWPALQIRLKDAPDEIVAAAVDALMPIAQARGVALILNDRPDLAAGSSAGCDGVHIGQEDASLAEARRIVGKDRMVGVTCHDSLHLAMEAAEGGADYVAFGAFFPTTTKDASTRAEPELLTGWRRSDHDRSTASPSAGSAIAVPTAREIAAAGADFVAVSAGVWTFAEVPTGASRRRRHANAEIAKGAWRQPTTAYSGRTYWGQGSAATSRRGWPVPVWVIRWPRQAGSASAANSLVTSSPFLEQRDIHRAGPAGQGEVRNTSPPATH